MRWLSRSPLITTRVTKSGRYSCNIKPLDTLKEYKTHVSTKRRLDNYQRTLHMSSIHNALAAHLKKYYRVDIPIASDGRVEFAWTRRNTEPILNQLYERFKDLPAGSKGKQA